MKPPKISELLEKVNRIIGDAGFSKLSKLEMDLLKQHLRDLYSELDAVENVVGQATNNSNKLTINPNQNVLLSEPVITEVVKPVKEELPVKTETKLKEPVSKSSINESAQSVTSLNEKVKTPAREVHKKLSTKPLKDLIDLNKKFVFQNELFKGNAEAFAYAISQIDGAGDFATAETFIKQELQPDYNWNESSQTVRLFMKLVKQKFGDEE